MPEDHTKHKRADATGDEARPEPPAQPRVPDWMNGSFRIGIHTSIAGDIARSLKIARRLGCNALQIFSASPRSWAEQAGREIGRFTAADAARFRERRASLGLAPLVVHDNYLINLAASEPMLRVRSIQAFHGELTRALALGSDFLVAHPGNRRGLEPARAVEAIAAALRQAARGIRFNGLRILLENTAGQGTAVGSRLEELQAILQVCPELPLGVCLDTAHLFAAGYDVGSEAGLARTLEAIDRTIGLERVFVVHMNDSKAPLGSRVDRHAHIGGGHIGRAALGRILHHRELAGRAFILETPIDRPGDDRRNVRALWELAGVLRPRKRRTARKARRVGAGRKRRPARR